MRFLDNNDGTVTDTKTGLVWLKDLTELKAETWEGAKETCAALDMAGGGWRLPSIEELISLVNYSEFNPALINDHPFSGVRSMFYWSSSTYVGNPGYAWIVNLRNGNVYLDGKDYSNYVWPVRGGS